MDFEPTPDPQDLSPEQRRWIDRYVAVIPTLEAMADERRQSFDALIDQILAERFGSFPVVAHVLDTGEPSIEVLPFLVPVVEELLAHLADGTLIETPQSWIVIDEETRDLELDTDVLGITDTPMGERFEVLMMELRGLEPDHRAAIVEIVFDIVETHFMEHPGIAAYYATARPNDEAAHVIVPLFEAALAGNRTFSD